MVLPARCYKECFTQAYSCLWNCSYISIRHLTTSSSLKEKSCDEQGNYCKGDKKNSNESKESPSCFNFPETHFPNRKGIFFTSLLHKTIHELNRKSLIGDLQNYELDLEISASDESNVPSTESQNNLSKFQKKYVHPSENEISILEKEFPNSERLLVDVVSYFLQAGLLCVDLISLKSHMKGFYYEARTTWTFPKKLTVTAVHLDADRALHSVILLNCKFMRDLGAISKDANGSWQPVTSESVQNWLEDLAAFKESIVGNRKIPDFKITFTKCKTLNNSLELPPQVKLSSTILSELENVRKMCESDNSKQFQHKNENIDKKFVDITFDSSKSYLKTGNVFTDCFNKIVQLCKDRIVVSSSFKGICWTGCIRVSWPIPYTIKTTAPSLSAAQMLAYFETGILLKYCKLVDHNNKSLNKKVLVNNVYLATRRTISDLHMKFRSDQTIEKLDVDAEIFTDASIYGFGAFLVPGNNVPIHWISKAWTNYPKLTSLLLENTTLFEMFVMATAICTWKSKLRNKRVLLLGDNMMSVSYVDCLADKKLNHKCLLPYDHFIEYIHRVTNEYNIQLHTAWVPRENNWLADKLSRQDIESFLNTVPVAHAYMSKVKPVIPKSVPK